MDKPSIRVAHLSEFRPQKRNTNRHTQRGLGMLETAMQQDGYVAPMTATADGEIIDGSARLEVSGHRFDGDVIVVEHDGTRPIVARRTDIPSADDPRAKRIAVAANRIAQVDLEWDAEMLGALAKEVDLSSLWSEEELDEVLSKIPNVEFKEYDEGAADGVSVCRCTTCGNEHAKRK